MSAVTTTLVQIALAVMVFLLLPCAFRAFRGPTQADRLQAIDTSNALLVGIILLLAPALGTALVIDVALALAAFGFISTLALARYLAEGRVF